MGSEARTIDDEFITPISVTLRMVRGIITLERRDDPRVWRQNALERAAELVGIHGIDVAERLLNTEIARAVYHEGVRMRAERFAAHHLASPQ